MHVYVGPGAYLVKLNVTNAKGYSSSSSDTVNIINTGIASYKSPINFNIYPNPTLGNLTLECMSNNFSGKLHVFIVDMQGRKIIEQNMENTGLNSLDISHVKPRAYLLYINDNKNRFRQMIMKE